MALRLTAIAGALINGLVWMLLSLLILPTSWAMLFGVLAAIGALPVMAAVVSAQNIPVTSDESHQTEPAVRLPAHPLYETQDVTDTMSA